MPPRVRPPLHRGPAESTPGDAGFTVLEVLVSFVILAVVSAAAIMAVVADTRASKSATDRSIAANLAQGDEYAAQALRYPSYPAALAARTVTVNGTRYTVTRTVGSACPSTPNYTTNSAMTVTSTVSWPSAQGTQQLAMTQELAC